MELFVGVLGASSYTYAEATRTQRVPDFIASHGRMLAFFGGVPKAMVPDQLKSAVTAASRYEPGLQRTYEDFAEHYGTAIVPARPAKPRDKAMVEAAVLVAQRWILARMRGQRFFSEASLPVRCNRLLDAGQPRGSGRPSPCAYSRRRHRQPATVDPWRPSQDSAELA